MAFIMALIRAIVFMFVDFEVEFNEKGLISLLELLDVGLGVLEQVDFLSF